jgi:hypothetical protein
MSTLRTNAIQTTAGKPILNSTGGILQVVTGTSTTDVITTSNTFVASSLFADITPSSSTSRILIMLHSWTRTPGVANIHNWTTIFRNDSVNLAGNMSNIYTAASYLESPQSLIWLDSPATTASTRYRLYFRSQVAGNDVAAGGGRTQSIVLMEVA